MGFFRCGGGYVHLWDLFSCICAFVEFFQFLQHCVAIKLAGDGDDGVFCGVVSLEKVGEVVPGEGGN